MVHSQTVSQRRRAASAAFIGTCIEWYDFYVFSVAAALVLGPAFFPTAEPATALAASFATYAVGFFARPLGAIIFGQIGDRVGRRHALIVTLMMMGVATCLTGLLPTYESIGMWAPLLLVLLRIIQGIAVGGEWGGAVLMSVENAPEESKAFYGGFVQLGNPAGGMLATGVFSALSLLGDDALHSWAWRIAFLVSALLIVVGLIIRAKVEESPVFEAMSTQQGNPLKSALTHNWRAILLAIGILAVPSGGYYLTSTYFTSFATEHGGIDTTLVLNILTLGSFVELLFTIPTAWLADKLGRIRVLVAGIIGLGVFGALTFQVASISNQNPTLLIVVFVFLRIAGCGAYAALAGVIAQMFPAESRYTSISLGYQVGSAIFGGLSPLAATLLFGATGSIWAVIGLLIGFCILATGCALAAPQLRDKTEHTAETAYS